ncbi:hypothetical protein [Nocardioides sp.]|uniref:hypothetical protein n=1 Tax=Nocardioides sp. TaxID=35761 RepID=UPI00262F0171|nr:hypothetical protein [Nocardioides sp.]
MKPLAVIAALAAVAYLIARKTGLLSKEQVQDLADQAKSVGESALSTVTDTVSEAVETVSNHASDVLPKHS